MKKEKIIKLLRIVITVLCALGMIWFFLPILGGGYNVGSAFWQLMCLITALTANFAGKMEKRRAKLFMNIWLIILGLGLLWVMFLTIQINLAQIETKAPEDSVVIVLGAKAYADRPSLSLQTRLDAAYDFLILNPDAKCIVTGGQGADEPRPEAHVERDYLLKLGIEDERIFVEDTSTNTKENLENAMEIAEENNLETNAVIATQGFHQFRAGELAKQVGFTPYAAVAYTKPVLYPGYYGRELLSLTKFYLEKLNPFKGG